jgi:hypothetical protein
MLSENSDALTEACELLRNDIREKMREIQSFILTPEFRRVYNELMSFPPHLRHEFVELIMLNPEELKKRGIDVPSGLKIQRSEFADKRPTLFCITNHLSENMGWKKITITFDNPLGTPHIPIDANRIEKA